MPGNPPASPAATAFRHQRGWGVKPPTVFQETGMNRHRRKTDPHGVFTLTALTASAAASATATIYTMVCLLDWATTWGSMP